MTTDEPLRVDAETPDLAAEKLAQLQELFPGAIADGVVDAARIGELVGMPVAGLKEGRERYGLMWAGKQEAVASLLKPSRGTLVPDMDRSIDFNNARNVFIEGDNLEVLKILQKSYNDQVKLIYIDPPYNTGNDFVYNDDFSDGLRGYLEYTGQIDSEGKRTSAAGETSGRRHSGWLSMMYPRLALARNLLRQDGVLIASIDENEVTRLRLLLDEVFGEENFVAQLTILCNPKGRSQDKYFATNHEYALVYTRTTLPVGAFSVEKDAAQLERDYPLADELGKYRLLELRNTHREFGKHNRPNLYYPLFAEADGAVHLDDGPGRTEVLPVWNDGYVGCWTWGRDKAARELDALHARDVGGVMKVYRKDYAKGARRMLKTILSEANYTTESGQRVLDGLFASEGKVFPSPKSPYLLSDLFATCTTSDDIVLDFFAGSGTTAHAVANLNWADGQRRRVISINLPEPVPEDSNAAAKGMNVVSDITYRRLRKVLESVNGAGRDGLRVLTLGESCFARVEFTDDLVAFVESSLRAGAAARDIAQEALLREGVRLDRPWATTDLGGAERFASGGVTVVTDLELTQEAIDAAIESNPRVLVFLEDAFSGKDALKASAFYACKQAGVTMKTV